MMLVHVPLLVLLSSSSSRVVRTAQEGLPHVAEAMERRCRWLS